MIQLQVLNKILSDKDLNFFNTYNLSEDFFSDYKSEYLFIKNHIDKYNNIPDLETFLSKFPSFDVVNVNESDDYLVKELYNDKNSRTLANTFNKIRDLLTDGKVDDALNLFTTSSQNISKDNQLQAIDIITDTSRYDKYVDKCRNHSIAYVKTGFPELDSIIGGWDRDEEYVTIVARPGTGKTWLALKTASTAAEQGFTVGIYSGEMSVNKVAYRIDTMFGHISNKSLTHGNVEIQNEYKKYIDNLSQNIKGHIKVLTPDLIGKPATVSSLKTFIEKENLDMLVIDQHSLLEDERKGKSPVEKAANISRDIKNLQVMERIPIITVSQQNRESSEDGLSTKLISQADRIGQDSTIVIFVEQKDNVLTLSLVKSRDSESNKKLQYAIDLDKGIFNYIPAESDGVQGTTETIIASQPYLDESVSGAEVF